MTKEEKETWDAFVDVCGNFLGKRRDPEAKNMVENVIKKSLKNVSVECH